MTWGSNETEQHKLLSREGTPQVVQSAQALMEDRMDTDADSHTGGSSVRHVEGQEAHTLAMERVGKKNMAGLVEQQAVEVTARS